MGDGGFMELQDTVVRHRSTLQRRFGYLLVGVVFLFIGGCTVIAFASVEDGIDDSTGVADPDDYEVTLSTCDSNGRSPVAAGTIRNFRWDITSYRVRVHAIDAVTTDVIAARSVVVSVEVGESEPFDMVIVDMRNVTDTTTPESIVCSVSVFYSS